MLTGLRWLETYVPRSLVRRLLGSADGGRLLSTERVATLMFTDIVGFARTSESMTAADVAEMLNSHFDLLGRCVEAEGGTIDKFIGDCVMAFWGAPDDQPDHADRALRAARAIANALVTDNAARHARGLTPIRIRLGVHTGPVVAGNIGTRDRAGYTVVGDTVNVANRLEQLGKSIAPDDDLVILISGDTVACLQDRSDGLVPLGSHVVPGRATAIDIFRLQQSQR
jgi:class 3 adenylate cyclase